MYWQTTTTSDWRDAGWHHWGMPGISGGYFGTGLFFIASILLVVLLILLVLLVAKKLK